MEDVNVIYGKHNEIQAPHNIFFFSFNYEKIFSVVFFALVGGNYKFPKWWGTFHNINVEQIALRQYA